MTEVDVLNTACSAYAKELTQTWMFTGWKPAQSNTRLHAQWLRGDKYGGEKFYTVLQCLPLEGAEVEDVETAQRLMKQALEEAGGMR